MTFTVTLDILDFIQYTKTMHEKRTELEKQQIHLNVGLKRINETVSQVDELRKELIKTSLKEAEHNANEKLKVMIAGQQDAEQNKKKSTEI